jgi:uncharacterized membrane protein
MNLQLEPLWPWQPLYAFLKGAGAREQAAAVLAALLSFTLPLWWARPPFGAPRRPVVLGAGAVLVALLLHLARSAWGTPADEGWPAPLGLLAFAALLALLGGSVATYAAVPGASPGRLRAVAILRLLALLLTFVAVVRPSLASIDLDPAQSRSQIVILLDDSKSMTIGDEEAEPKQRWAHLLHHLRTSEPALKRLRAQGVDVRFFRFAGDLRDFDPKAPGEADGKTTDYGAALRAALKRREPQHRALRLLVVGDGAEHGSGGPEAAVEWGNLPCRVDAFWCGSERTTPRQKDLAITNISTRPAPFVPVKGKLTVRVTVSARGYVNSPATLKLFLEGPDGKYAEKAAKEVRLERETGNTIDLECVAPDAPGEVKVKVEAQAPGDPDPFPENNVIETFVTVSREGVSVLLVDRPRAWEPSRIFDSLADDNRIRLTALWVGGKGPAGGAARVFADDQRYDVIILGDVTGAQLQAINDKALARIDQLVREGSGLLMIAGYDSFTEPAWGGTPIARLLPVVLNKEQAPVLDPDEEEKHKYVLRPLPTARPLAPSLLRLTDGPEKDSDKAWKRLIMVGRSELVLPEPRTNEVVLADAFEPGDNGKRLGPLLVMKEVAGTGGKPGRVVAFGSDSTWRWVKDEATERLHARFWKQLVVWLAHQEDVQGNVWVRPDVRRLAVRNPINFAVGLRDRAGGPDLRGGSFKVEVTRPDGSKKVVPVRARVTEDRGALAKEDTALPGTYRITVRGEGKGQKGPVTGEAFARVIVYPEEDPELAKAAAKPEFLAELAARGGGRVFITKEGAVEKRRPYRVEELPAYLASLAQEQAEWEGPRQREVKRPNWAGRGDWPSPFVLAVFGLFVGVVCLEWGLRRRWGMA